jgi:uncharacterized repeat protein (TIGR02543 family)
VYVGNGTFAMSGGKISGNTTGTEYGYGNGGGVCVVGTFAMNGGEIRGNIARTIGGSFFSSFGYGGGVYVNSGTFTKHSGGVIYGSDANAVLKNTAFGDDRGHAVYVISSGRMRSATAGDGVTLDSEMSGAVGGWEGPISGQYTVTFDADGGSPATQMRTVNSGSSVGTANWPSAPSKTNYIFGGWYTQQNGGGTQLTSSTTVTENITVYAKWTVTQHTVTFNADGGSPATQTRTVNSGSSVGSLPSAPSKTDYAFCGWYTGTNGGGTQFTASTTVSGNMTVYAKWTVTQYAVTFNADGGNPAMQTKTANSGSSFGSLPSAPTKTGYTFGGWYTTANGGGTQFTASTTVSENMEVYAKWTIIQYTVTFNADGGSPATQTKMINSGSSVGTANWPSVPSKANYTFGGWYTQQNGGGTQFIASTTVSGNTTVYAKWTVTQHTVTFNADGGSPATQTRTVNSGSSVGSLPSAPSKTGYSFGGWYTATSGGGTQFTALTIVTGNITVYAKWTIIPMPDNLSLTQSLAWINSNATTGGSYTITLDANETIAPQTLFYSGKTIRITLTGGAAERTISLSSTGSLFTVGSGVTLTLGSNVALQGRFYNTSAVVYVEKGGALVMDTGSKISGNTNNSDYADSGGGVRLHGGTFTMNGGTISNNSSNVGGGVYVNTTEFYVGEPIDPGTFTMNGGTISGNSASGRGGGVHIAHGTFTMNDGTISGNTATDKGGGVYIQGSNASFRKRSGTIYGSNTEAALQNTASGDSSGHAVYVNASSSHSSIVIMQRNTTAGEGVTLDRMKSGAAGGWE